MSTTLGLVRKTLANSTACPAAARAPVAFHVSVAQTPILYDADCGFCRAALAAVLLWDHERRLRPVAIQGREGATLLSGMDEEARLASWHLVPPGEAPLSAGSAFPAVFRRMPGGEPFAALTERFPHAAERGYRWVAENRTALSKLVPGAVKRRADTLVAERS